MASTGRRRPWLEAGATRPAPLGQRRMGVGVMSRSESRQLPAVRLASAELFGAPTESLSPFPLDARACGYVGEHSEVLRVERLSLDFYDHLALCAPLFDVGQGFHGRLEWKDPVYNGTNSTRIDE